MKWLEYIGVSGSVIAYLLIVTGDLVNGFTLGALASVCLALYFYILRSFPSSILQLFFICANVFGLTRLAGLI